jgi:hypothetical protein
VAKAIAAKDPDMAERQIVLHLFDVVRRIESNLKIDLQQRTLCGFDLLQAGTDARRTRRK